MCPRVLLFVLAFAVCAPLCSADRSSHDKGFLERLRAIRDQRAVVRQRSSCYNAYQDQTPDAKDIAARHGAYTEAFRKAYHKIHRSIETANFVMFSWGLKEPDLSRAFTAEVADQLITNAFSDRPLDGTGQAFLQFQPIHPPPFCRAMGNKFRAARVSVSLKSKANDRPSHLFQIFQALIGHADLRKRIVRSKIETSLRYIRTDAILLQLCYEGSGAELLPLLEDVSKLLGDAKDTESGELLSSFITDEGPYLQKPCGLFSIGDYTPGRVKGGVTSWGEDICCIFKLVGVEGLQAILAEAFKTEIPRLGAFVETYPCDAAHEYDDKKDCKNHCALTVAGHAVVNAAQPVAALFPPPKFTARRMSRKSRRH